MDNSKATPSNSNETNSTVQLAESSVENVKVKTTTEHANPGSTEVAAEQPAHPYLEDIMKCPCNEWQLTKADPIPCKSLEDIPYTIIDTKQLLNGMMEKLRSEKEIAITTKRSKYCSFDGKSCLIQMATHSEVFLVDTISLKDDIKVLNEVLTSTGVLKVSNMVENYVEDLQKDLGLYMVNMFCLGIAWRTLNPEIKKKVTIAKHQSVAGLLKEHCGVDFKTFQLEMRKNQDAKNEKHLNLRWDERPLSEDQVKYLRMEVQYLLHVYQKFRNSLIDKALLNQVYDECRNVCNVVWYPGKHKIHENSHMFAYSRMAAGRLATKMEELNKIQMEVLRVLYEWRYNTAMTHDEHPAVILRDFAMYQVALGLPKDADGVKECLPKLSDTSSHDVLSPLLEQNLEVVCGLIAKVVEEMSGSPGADEKVPFPSDSEDNRKRKDQEDVKCPTCGKNEHNAGDKCSQKRQKKRQKEQEREKERQQKQKQQQRQLKQQNKQPSRGGSRFNVQSNWNAQDNAQNNWHYEQPSYPLNPMMGAQMGFMGPQGMCPSGFFANQSRSGWQHQQFR